MIIKNVKIENISNDYKGICFINNKKCFVDDALCGDIIDIEIYKETKDFFCSKIIKIIKKSIHREESIKCEFFKKCGGCSLQHLKYDYYCELKKDNFYNNIIKIGFNVNEKIIDFFTVNCGKRRRINIKYQNGKYGFFSKNNNNIIAIDKCINVSENINNILNLFKNLKFTNLNSIDIFEGYNGIGINLIFDKEPNIEEFKKLDIFKDIISYINYTYIDKKNFIPIIKNFDLVLNLDGFVIKLPNNFFMQATTESQDFMINNIKKNLFDCSKVADLYSGIGTYSFPLSKTHTIDCFEGDELMVKSMKNNINMLNVKNLNVYHKDLFNQPILLNDFNKYDAVIINPPRNGATNQCKILSKSNVKKIIYVSCDKSSLINDLKFFKDTFNIQKIILVDQFFWSNHIEIICILVKK